MIDQFTIDKSHMELAVCIQGLAGWCEHICQQVLLYLNHTSPVLNLGRAIPGIIRVSSISWYFSVAILTILLN